MRRGNVSPKDYMILQCCVEADLNKHLYKNECITMYQVPAVRVSWKGVLQRQSMSYIMSAQLNLPWCKSMAADTVHFP